MARSTNGGSGDPEAGGQAAGSTAGSGTAVGELTYSAAGQELDRIIEEFEAGVIDVDRLVERLERATEIVDELDQRLRRTRMQVEELVPRLERIGRPDTSGRDEDASPVDKVDESDETYEAAIIEEISIEETEVDLDIEDEEESPPGLF